MGYFLSTNYAIRNLRQKLSYSFLLEMMNFACFLISSSEFVIGKIRLQSVFDLNDAFAT
jgi:hypothetical protein